MSEGQTEQAQLTLSPDQKAAHNSIRRWLEGGIAQLSLGGYAGTGKTTLLKYLLDDFTDRCYPQVMSLTGKAVSVLIGKGIDARTIHSTIYNVEIKNKKPVFHLKEHLDNPTDLFIVDEASMVSFELYDDLLSFGIPILWVGDHGQLEPIGRNPKVMSNPQIKLEKIHRQAEGNPIIMFADKVRRGAHPDAIAKKDVPEVIVTRKRQVEDEQIQSADQVICALNRTRVKLNRYIRSLRGYPVEDPCVGDRIVCLKNNRYEGLYNGLQGTICAIWKDKNWPLYRALVELDGRRAWEGEMLADQFNKLKGLVEPERAYWRATNWDYAYAITCHKAQGSEWPCVLVMDEQAGPLWAPARWRYTAVTRASERLIYAT
jgi:exodeoxyribonuclease-5